MAEDTGKMEDNGRNPDGTFKDGHAGGPGRPRGVSITRIIQERLAMVPKGQMETYAELIAGEILKKAYVDGDTTLIKEIWHYMDGSPKQSVTLDADKESIDSLTALLREAANVKVPKS